MISHVTSVVFSVQLRARMQEMYDELDDVAQDNMPTFDHIETARDNIEAAMDLLNDPPPDNGGHFLVAVGMFELSPF